MNFAEDRVLELALQEVLGGQGPPDISASVLDAVKRRRLRRAPTRRPGQQPRVASLWTKKRVHAAAGALLVAAVLLVGLIWWVGSKHRRSADVVVVARSAEALRIVGADGQSRTDRAVRSGDHVVVPGPRAATLDLEDDGSVEMSPGTLLEVGADPEGPVISLRVGSCRVRHGGRRPVRVSSPLASATLEAGCELSYTLQSREELERQAFLEQAKVWILTTPPPVPSALVTVEEGRAYVVTPSGTRWAVSGTDFHVRRGGKIQEGRLPSKQDKRALDALLLRLQRSESDADSPSPEAYKELKLDTLRARSDLLRRLEQRPQEWDFVSFRLQPLPADARRRDVKGRLLKILVRDPLLRADGEIRDALTNDPSIFEPDSLLLLAERGYEPATEPLSALIAEPSFRMAQIWPAVYFAMRRDGRGRKVLDRVLVEPEFFRKSPVHWIGATAGLHTLGDDRGWRASVRMVSRRVEEELAEGRLRTARWFVLRLAYFHETVSSGRPVKVAEVERLLARYEREQEADVRSAAEVRALLRKIARS